LSGGTIATTAASPKTKGRCRRVGAT
jgi:hypothetical protein